MKNPTSESEINKDFSDPKIDPVDRLLFTFAAYNAGPTRIAELRKRAPAQGPATLSCWLPKASGK